MEEDLKDRIITNTRQQLMQAMATNAELAAMIQYLQQQQLTDSSEEQDDEQALPTVEES